LIVITTTSPAHTELALSTSKSFLNLIYLADPTRSVTTTAVAAAVTTMMAAEGMAKMAVMTETVVAVYRRGHWFISSVSEVRMMWNITPLISSWIQPSPESNDVWYGMRGLHWF
jgi:hypothetical protein